MLGFRLSCQEEGKEDWVTFHDDHLDESCESYGVIAATIKPLLKGIEQEIKEETGIKHTVEITFWLMPEDFKGEPETDHQVI